MDIKAELQKPYNGKPHEAKSFKLTVTEGTYGKEYKTTLDLPLTEAMVLMKQLAEGLNEYRASMQSEFTASIDSTISALDAVLEK